MVAISSPSLRQRVSLYKAANHEITTTTPVEQRRTLSWDELEDWQKDNEFITHGYRRYVARYLVCACGFI